MTRRHLRTLALLRETGVAPTPQAIPEIEARAVGAGVEPPACALGSGGSPPTPCPRR